MATHPRVAEFDPDMMARLEASGWKAYYDRKWLKALLLMLRLDQEQMHIPFPRSVVAAGTIVQASIAFAPADHDTALEQVRACLRRFYALVAAANAAGFDPDQVGDLGLDYWIVHRQLATARAADYTPLVGIAGAAARGHLRRHRGRHAALRREPGAGGLSCGPITSKRSEDPEQDWRQVYFTCAAALRTNQSAVVSLSPAGQHRPPGKATGRVGAMIDDSACRTLFGST